MGPLWSAYDNPQGELPADGLEALMDAAQEAYAEVERIDQLDIVVESMEPVAEEIQTVAAQGGAGPLKIRLSGSTDVQTICPGQGTNPTSDASNGIVTYKMTFLENWLQEVAWGQFQDCEINGAGEPGTLNGSWALSVGVPQEISSFTVDKVLFSIDATWEGAAGSEQLDSTFRVSVDGGVELGVPADGGDVVFGFGETAAEAVVRTGDGSFCCDFSKQECFAVVGDSCENPVDGGHRISW